MATIVHAVEREFLFKAAKEEHKTIFCAASGGTWNLTIRDFTNDSTTFNHAIPLQLLRLGAVYDFHFLIKNQTIAFRGRVQSVTEASFAIETPQTVFKNLSRHFARLAPPRNLAVSFAFMGERYALDFPTTESFEPLHEPEPSPDFNPSDMRQLIQEFNAKAAAFASHRGIVLFKDRKPEGTDERLLAATALAFYYPTAVSGIPETDPFMDRHILIREDFIENAMKLGLDRDYAEDEVVRFEHAKRASGLLSELMVPIRFQEYVIGYAHLANKQIGKPPFDLLTFDIFSQFARIFAYSLKINGYFKNAPKRLADYAAEIMDISAGGMLFTTTDSRLSTAMLEGSSVGLSLAAGKRTMSLSGEVKRRFSDGRAFYYAVRFSDMQPEDFRFLFEFLYGKPFTDADADTIEGLPVRDLLR